MLVFHLRYGPLRSAALQHTLRGISNKMFTQTARELEADGIIRREIFPVVPPKVEYSLTPLGQTLIPIVESLAQWGVEISENGSEVSQSRCDLDLAALSAHRTEEPQAKSAGGSMSSSRESQSSG